MKIKARFLILNTILMLMTLMQFPSVSLANVTPIRIAILPFDLHAEKGLTFLQEGIQDMLGSRLAWKDKVNVIDKSEIKTALMAVEDFEGESRALMVGGKLQANYVLFGSLTVFGKSVSIDAKMVDVSGRNNPVPFFAQTDGMGSVIPQINRFATTINETIFGRGSDLQSEVVAASKSGATPIVHPQTASKADVVHMHPDKLLLYGGQPSSQIPEANQSNHTPNPAFVVTAEATGVDTSNRSFWKSRKFKALITGLDIADVNNDGKKEVIILSDKLLSIYRMENERLIKSAEVAKTRTGTYISVDAADINGNGIPEMYITGLEGNRTTVNSLIVEYSDNGYKTISDGNNWYYRVAHTIDRGTVLIGQRQRMGEKSISAGEIYEMSWQDNRLVSGKKLIKGGKINLIGVTCADITQNGLSNIIAYSDWDRIRVYGNSGEVIWEDGDRSGGNNLFLNLPKIDPGQENKQFLPLRIRTATIDQDGQTEILIARHNELAESKLQNFRAFSKAQIESMVWNGLGLASKWRTQSLGGRVSDFVVGDFDNDGSDELVVAVVSKEGGIALTDAASSLIAFELYQN